MVLVHLGLGHKQNKQTCHGQCTFHGAFINSLAAPALCHPHERTPPRVRELQLHPHNLRLTSKIGQCIRPPPPLTDHAGYWIAEPAICIVFTQLKADVTSHVRGLQRPNQSLISKRISSNGCTHTKKKKKKLQIRISVSKLPY